MHDWYSPLTLVDAWKAAAGSGSMSIRSPFFLVTAAFLNSIWFLIQAVNGDFTTEAMTLHIHSFGTLWISCSSGR